jgi:hypothetical protein
MIKVGQKVYVEPYDTIGIVHEVKVRTVKVIIPTPTGEEIIEIAIFLVRAVRWADYLYQILKPIVKKYWRKWKRKST